MLSLTTASDLLHLMGDPTRARLLSLLEQDELSVAELMQITSLGQSRVSTHLGKLRDAGLVRDRRQGASIYYRVPDQTLPEPAQSLWQLLKSQLQDALISADRQRCETLLASREAGMGWPESVAGRMEQHYSPGRTWEATARGLLGLLRLGHVLDAGSGDGALTALLAPTAQHVTCLDRSERVLEAARARLGSLPNVGFALGDLHEIPFPDAHFDQVLLFNVLTCARSPSRVLTEATRVLRHGGQLAIVTLGAHDHLDLTASYGHVHAGFAPDTLIEMLIGQGLNVSHCGVTSRERREPNFNVITAFATRSRVKENHAPADDRTIPA